MRADGFAEVQIQQAVQYGERVLLAARDDAEYQEVTTHCVHGVQHHPWYH
jgi:hypothetical protein